MKRLLKVGAIVLALVFILVTNIHAQASASQFYYLSVQRDSVIVQPDTLFLLTANSLVEIPEIKITNAGAGPVSVDTALVTHNWSYEPVDSSENFLSYPQVIAPGDSVIIFLRVAMLTGGGVSASILTDTVTVVMNLRQKDIIIVLDSNLVSEVSEPSADGISTSFLLKQNYPNPFNPETRITYALSTGGKVSLDIFNLLGQKIRPLVSGQQSPGPHAVT